MEKIKLKDVRTELGITSVLLGKYLRQLNISSKLVHSGSRDRAISLKDYNALIKYLNEPFKKGRPSKKESE